VRQWKRLENQPLTSPTAGETSKDDLGEPSTGEPVRGESGISSAGGGGAAQEYILWEGGERDK
jgi:hypothetical protein